ncbi:MAG: D-alanyl-D-alanine carboxypeptidase [Desulfitobacteriaceae bacterium]|nr:D-alanyl-D-alanine carboxypeptidase [Desulfitobacteriaceae bacterium]MDD4346882.1 D-alanyl-D-alanine carboxypeptidase [Desulfitobacteriaceae bacterium]MDD4401704.1 D-alanyl-D-alanine carboxypeptidase [Desulfitobacteriaceae bacterium]
MRGLLVFIFTLCFLFNSTLAQAISKDSDLKAVCSQVTAASAILMDLKSGQILFERKPHDRLAIASITKIMTAMVAIEKGDLDSVITVGPEVLDRKDLYGTLIYLSPGEKFTLRQLLAALLMNSANDAAVTIAESVGGTKENFVQMMNQKAKDLGLKNTHFTNPHGLSEIGHYSSAYDMAMITRYGLEKPTLAEIVKTKIAQFPRKQGMMPDSLQNHNKLLWQYDGANGVKTGYTDLAGNTLVASATRHERKLLVVILKGTSAAAVYQDAGNLLDYGFNQFNNQLIASKNQVINSVNLGKGQTLNLIPKIDIYGTFSNSTFKQDFELKAIPVNINLPVEAGDELGRVDVYFEGDVIQSVPLVAYNSISLSRSNNIKYFLFGGILLFFLYIIRRILHYVRLRRRRRIFYR